MADLRSSSVGDPLRAPIPRQEFVNALGGMIRQAAEYIGEPSLRIDVVELGAGDEGVDGRGASAALIGACEGPILLPTATSRSSRSAALFNMQSCPSSIIVSRTLGVLRAFMTHRFPHLRRA